MAAFKCFLWHCFEMSRGRKPVYVLNDTVMYKTCEKTQIKLAPEKKTTVSNCSGFVMHAREFHRSSRAPHSLRGKTVEALNNPPPHCTSWALKEASRATPQCCPPQSRKCLGKHGDPK
ncbi:hypothetical protein CK203_094254 [Vitis vinifera]|uniref:Uncharacterized protein n=1 Tax=Vitis vinifera TaxID=29760 RepID=A0A438DD22_VITVI|nr:hypothetical protein CK203_094254 [Vitis vinifera]